jgi:tetrathionate reductase subunit B
MTLTMLSPPSVLADRCAAGSEAAGCRICRDACPYGAITLQTRPGGPEVRIDPDRCVRCGACSGACPTSAIERPFLPDDELVRSLVDGARSRPSPILVVTCADERQPDATADDVVRIALPSLMVLNETHLLAAVVAGARAVIVEACAACAHSSPELIREPVSVADTLLGSDGRISYVDWMSAGLLRDAISAARGLPASTIDAPVSHLDGIATVETRRDRLRLILPLLGEATTLPMPAIGFGTILLDEETCVMCGACATSCPTSALRFDGAAATLTVTDVDCIACGACAAACPEDAISLVDAVPAGRAAFDRRTLLTDDVVACSVCDRDFAPARLIDHSRGALAAAGFDPDDALFQVGTCPECRRVTELDAPPQPSRPPAEDTDEPRRADKHPAPTPTHQGAFLGDVIPTAREPVGMMGRRDFLKSLGAVTAFGAVHSVVGGSTPAAGASEPPVIRPGRLGMVIDLERCIGCHACTAVCKAENNVPLGVYRDWVEEHTLGKYPHARPVFLPKLCNHCDDPGCLRACPTGAIFKRRDGIVDLDPNVCIACQACMQGCPYGMTFYNPARGTADKCNLCAHRIDEGLNPACVDVCPSQCRIVGDFDDPESPVSVYLRDRQGTALREEYGLGPNVRYVGLPGELNR